VPLFFFCLNFTFYCKEFELAAKYLKVTPLELACVLAKFLGTGVRMSIMGDSSPLHGISIGPPFPLFCLRSGPLTGSKRESVWTEERVAKSMGIQLNKSGHPRVGVSWNRDTDGSAEWQRRAA
jgi:hypothetical protein